MTVIYGRNDLHKEAMNKPINEIGVYDFRRETRIFHEADVVLFRDRSGRTTILKNRHEQTSKERKEMYIEVVDEKWIKIR